MSESPERHELLGRSCCPPLILAASCGKPDDVSFRGAELIDHAGDQRNLGTDHGEIGIDGIRRRQAFRGRQKLADFGDSRIAGRAIYLMTFLRQSPGDRMLAAAATSRYAETGIFRDC